MSFASARHFAPATIATAMISRATTSKSESFHLTFLVHGSVMIRVRVIGLGWGLTLAIVTGAIVAEANAKLRGSAGE